MNEKDNNKNPFADFEYIKENHTEVEEDNTDWSIIDEREFELEDSIKAYATRDVSYRGEFDD